MSSHLDPISDQNDIPKCTYARAYAYACLYKLTTFCLHQLFEHSFEQYKKHCTVHGYHIKTYLHLNGRVGKETPRRRICNCLWGCGIESVFEDKWHGPRAGVTHFYRGPEHDVCATTCGPVRHNLPRLIGCVGHDMNSTQPFKNQALFIKTTYFINRILRFITIVKRCLS